MKKEKEGKRKKGGMVLKGKVRRSFHISILGCNRRSNFLWRINADSPQLMYFTSFFHFFFLSIDIGAAPRTTRTLYNNTERRMLGSSLLFSILPPLSNIADINIHHSSSFS
jgi:hypothetical protein